MLMIIFASSLEVRVLLSGVIYQAHFIDMLVILSRGEISSQVGIL